MSNPFEIPSLEQIEQIDRKRDKALDAVEISVSETGEPQYVKCQKCGNAVPIVGKLNRPKNDRVAILERRIKWIEDHYHDNHHDKNNELKAARAEIAELLEKDARAEKRRSIPLQYWRGKCVCGACLDKLIRRAR